MVLTDTIADMLTRIRNILMVKGETVEVPASKEKKAIAEILLNEGEALFHKPNEFHSLAADGRAPSNVFIISFECKSEAIRFFENKRLQLNKKFLEYIYRIVEESKKTFFFSF